MNLRNLVAVWLLIGAAALPARAADFWVAPNGNDGNPGTRSRPFATPARALRAARDLRRHSATPPAGGVHIVLRGGVYWLAGTWWIRPADSGTPSSPTVVEAAPGEHPVVSGGIELGSWRWPANLPAGLPAAAEGHVWEARVPRVDGSELAVRQLWVDGHRAARARSPNAGTMAHLLAWNRSRQVAEISANLVRGLTGRPRRADRGLDPGGGAEMVVAQQWEIAILRVRSVQIAGDRARVTFEQPESGLEFAHPWPQPILPPQGAGAFYLTGSVAFLDQPGEWCQAPAPDRIFYWPRPGERPARESAVAPVLSAVLCVQGTLDRPVHDVHFRGITFAHGAWLRPARRGHVPLQEGMYLRSAYRLSPAGVPGRPKLDNQAWVGRMPAAVRVTAAERVGFERCRFEHLAASGLDLGRGVHDAVVEGCVFCDIGGNGIQVGSFRAGPVETHVPYDPADSRVVCGPVRIDNNLVTDCGVEDWGCVGIGVGYARHVDIVHNEVRDLPYTGISLGWGWTPAQNCLRDNRVFANRIERVATRLCDTAGIYTLSAQPGTVIADNVVGPITMSRYVDRPDHWFYLYADEGSSHLTIRDNWCPVERFLKNANGPGNVWTDNGPMVSARIRAAAGLEAHYRDLLAAARAEPPDARGR
jgi:GH141 insertion domain